MYVWSLQKNYDFICR